MIDAIHSTLKNLMDASAPETWTLVMRRLQRDFGFSPDDKNALDESDVALWRERGFTKAQSVFLADLEAQAGTPSLRRAAVARYAELLRLQVAIAPLPCFTVVARHSPAQPPTRKTPGNSNPASLPPYVGMAFNARGIVTRRAVVGYGTAKDAISTASREGFSKVFDRLGAPVEMNGAALGIAKT
jgi:hypothetical protein